MNTVIDFPDTEKEQHAPNKPSYDEVLEMAHALTKVSSPEQVTDVLKATALAEFDPIEQDMILGAIQKKLGGRIKPLRQRLRMYQQEFGLLPNDLALDIARSIRNEIFSDGAHLVRCADGSYWIFDDTHWRATTGENLRRLILEKASRVFHLCEGTSLPALVGQAKTCLDDLLGTDEDVMGFSDDPSPVVNCANGELWIAADGTVELLPHRPESRLTRHSPYVDGPLLARCFAVL